MNRPLFSPSWHSVAELRPRLIAQARIVRHVYREQVWHVVSDPSGSKFHRLSPAAHEFVLRMDGRQSVQELWEALCRASDVTNAARDIPTQDEVVNLLVQLHTADLLQPDVVPDASLLFLRYRKRRNQPWKQWLMSPTSLKLPLVNPDPLLERWVAQLRWLFTPLGAMLWLAVVLPAALLGARHGGELTHNLADQVLSTSNLWVLAAVFPVVKLLHELGHGFATRAWGGRVNEMGIMLLVFAPAPYVDASSASAFPSKYRRAIVGAAGMLTELFLAALAMYLWVSVEPGLTRAVAFNVMVIAGVSTLVVNGNPLLRYDAYYILCDLLGMPNMAQRGQKLLQYLWNKHVFGLPDQEEPNETPSERRWLVAYSITSWCYRVFITLGIALFIASQFFIFGVLIALWTVIGLMVVPLWKAARFVLYDPRLERRRQRALRISGGLVAGILLLAFVLPLPARTQATGVVWLPEQSLLRAGANGFFARWLVPPGTPVVRGTPVAVLDDPLLTAELEVAQAKVEEARARLHSEQFTQPAKAEIAKRQLQQEEVQLARSRQRHARLMVVAGADGVLTAARPDDMPGQFYKQGELLGHVLEPRDLVARVAVQQADIDLVRKRFRSVQLRLAESLDQVHASRILREAASGIDELPTAALAVAHGGPIATDPKDQDSKRPLERVFVFDLQLPPGTAPSAFGERVFVRFSHAAEPLGWQGWRRLRQLFLSRFNV
ncbi:MAG: Peptidase [Ramlibacter sp.]|nr:Peptidase [Ramlibacter sp.]